MVMVVMVVMVILVMVVHLIADKLETAGQDEVSQLVNVKPLDTFNKTSDYFPALLAVLESRSPKPRTSNDRRIIETKSKTKAGKTQ